MVGVVSPLLLPLPTKTSSLSCEAFSISSKFDRSLVEGKQGWAWCQSKGWRPWRRSLRLTLTPWKRCYDSRQHLLPLNILCCQIWSKEGNHEGDHWSWSHEGHLRATFGPRRETMKRETMKKIIEADTDPKKGVLHLRPTFQAASFDHYSTSDRSKL